MKLTVLEYVFIALVVALVLALGWGGYEKYQRTKEQGAAVACQADVVSFKATQDVNLGTIGNLQSRLKAMVAQRKLEQDATDRALAQAAASAAAADKRNAAQAAQLEQLYARDATARAWGTAGVDAGVAARLPKR